MSHVYMPRLAAIVLLYQVVASIRGRHVNGQRAVVRPRTAEKQIGSWPHIESRTL